MLPKIDYCVGCVRHRSRGKRLMGKKRISEQQNGSLMCHRAFALTIGSV